MRKSVLICLTFLFCYAISIGQRNNLTIEEPSGAAPWSNLDINDKPGQFQFAIVTDRTGGHRPGVFLDGIRKLNLLQPEFVMSVGDLIEGYTEDLDELNRQWNEFNGFIEELEAPFFYVPGNHDITNKVMQDLYLEKFGKSYYHFVYNDVLFMCLNSEDQYRGAGRGTISDDQYEYIKTTLASNQDVKWTLLFLHQPLWNQENPERWPDVEKLLADRKHSVFMGHVHHYAKYERNNGKYFTLGTTGGGSRLRGPKMGEFDHVVWITMTEEGPIMANLQLEGIWDEDVSTEKTRAYLREVEQSNPFKIEPLFVDGDQFVSDIMKIKITNDLDIPMKVDFRERFSWDLKGAVDQNELEIAPNSVEFVEVELAAKKRARNLEKIEAMQLAATVQHLGEGIPAIEIPFTFLIAPEKKYKLTKTQKAINIDGDLADWEAVPYQIEGDDTSDASAKFSVYYDEDYVYIGATIQDDDIQTSTGAAVWNQDFVGFILNAAPKEKSAADNGRGWYRESLFVLQAPKNGDTPSVNNLEGITTKGIKTACKAEGKGYVMETAIPISYIKERQGEDWKTIRLNVVVQDKDAGETDMPRHLFKPDWRGKNNRIGSGMFFKE